MAGTRGGTKVTRANNRNVVVSSERIVSRPVSVTQEEWDRIFNKEDGDGEEEDSAESESDRPLRSCRFTRGQSSENKAEHHHSSRTAGGQDQDEAMQRLCGQTLLRDFIQG